MGKLYYLLFLLPFSVFSQPVFRKLPVKDTGLSFTNRVEENDSLHIFRYEYLYNGNGIGVGDFNGDGLTDILWLSDSGQVTDWLGQPNGAFYGNSGNFLAQISAGSHVLQTGDYNGDRADDILWRSDDGTITEWLGHANGSLTLNTSFPATHDPIF